MSARKPAEGLAFNQDIIKLIRQHYPKALQGDIEQNTQCANDMAVAMGALLAFAFRMNGDVIGRTVLQTMVKRIVDDATSIDAKAGAAIRQSLPKLLN